MERGLYLVRAYKKVVKAPTSGPQNVQPLRLQENVIRISGNWLDLVCKKIILMKSDISTEKTLEPSRYASKGSLKTESHLL